MDSGLEYSQRVCIKSLKNSFELMPNNFSKYTKFDFVILPTYLKLLNLVFLNIVTRENRLILTPLLIVSLQKLVTR